MPKVTLGIKGLPEILGLDYEIEKPYWGPSKLDTRHSGNTARCSLV